MRARRERDYWYRRAKRAETEMVAMRRQLVALEGSMSDTEKARAALSAHPLTGHRVAQIGVYSAAGDLVRAVDVDRHGALTAPLTLTEGDTLVLAGV